MNDSFANRPSSREPVREHSSSMVPMLAACLLLGGVACAAWRGAMGIYWFREWLRWRLEDPSIAEFYQVNWWFEIIPTVLGLLAAGIGITLLRRRR